MEYKSVSAALTEAVPLAGKSVLEVGCGDGSLAHFMAGQGARVVGIDPNAQQIATARNTASKGDASFVVGVAQELPAEAGSVDLVVFANSLHHVPVAALEQAIAEAGRVLKAGGMLYVSEPVAEGSRFELSRLVDDETWVREKALETLHAATRHGLGMESEYRFMTSGVIRDYESFREHQLKVDPERAGRLAEMRAELEAAFHRVGKKTEEGWEFEQPIRVNILRRS